MATDYEVTHVKSNNPDERYKVNVLYRGKERFKYCRTLKRAEFLQGEAVKSGLSSLIWKKVDGKYISLTYPTKGKLR